MQERVVFYREQEGLYREQLKQTSRVEGTVLVTDLRKEPIIHVGNRFLRYALYPDINLSLQVMWGLNRQNTVISLGKSIFNRTSPVHVGALLLRYGGGGHENAGTVSGSQRRGRSDPGRDPGDSERTRRIEVSDLKLLGIPLLDTLG